MTKIICYICGHEIKYPDPDCLTVTGYDGLDICVSCEREIIQFLTKMKFLKRRKKMTENTVEMSNEEIIDILESLVFGSFNRTTAKEREAIDTAIKTLKQGPILDKKQTDEGIKLGDEVASDRGTKGIVVGIDTWNGEVLLSLLMRNYNVPQLVFASEYKTKTGRHFPQIIEILKQIKGE